MISVLLLILKIIGITLLCILGIVLLLLLLILFAPVRYRIKGSFLDKKPSFKAVVYWFIPGLSLKAEFDEKLTYSLKWFGHIFFSEDDQEKESTKVKQKKEKKNKKHLSKSESKASDDLKEDKEAFSDTDDDLDFEEEFNTDSQEATDTGLESNGVLDKNEDSKSETSDGESERSDCEDVYTEQSDEFDEGSDFWLIRTVKKGLQKIKKIIKNIFDKIKNILNKIKNIFLNIFTCTNDIKKRISYYYNLWQKDATQKVWEDCKSRAVKLLKHLKPKKLQIDLHIGMDDPSTTGMIMGIWGMLYPIIGGTIHITPEFEDEILEGKLICKGRIRVFTVVWILLQFYRDKKLKKLIELVKKGGK